MSEHTPTPWRVVGGTIHASDKAGYVAELSSPRGGNQRDTDAAFIVKAVNNHDALVLLLHQAKAYLVIDQLSPAEHKFEVEKRMKYRDHIIEQISAALAGVVGTQSKPQEGGKS